ncbi:MAG: hypothetical protein ABIL45_04355 [candidate division WOR-3 bacterium]
MNSFLDKLFEFLNKIFTELIELIESEDKPLKKKVIYLGLFILTFYAFIFGVILTIIILVSGFLIILKNLKSLGLLAIGLFKGGNKI